MPIKQRYGCGFKGKVQIHIYGDCEELYIDKDDKVRAGCVEVTATVDRPGEPVLHWRLKYGSLTHALTATKRWVKGGEK